MSGRVTHKSRTTGRSAERHRKKKKSKKRSSSSSDDCGTVAGQRNPCGKDKRRKSRKKKRRRSCSSDSSSSESSVIRLKLETKPKQLLGERPEFCKNARRMYDTGISQDSRNHRLFGSHPKEHRNETLPRSQLGIMDRRVLNPSEEKAKKELLKRRSDPSQTAKKSRKSGKRRRSLSRSSSSSDSSSSESSSLSDSSSDSSSSSDVSSEKRRRRKKRKKKRLAKKLLKREEKKRREERRKLKKIMKAKSAVPVVQEIKRQMIKAPEDRLLKDINVELADRARAMAPMTREQWEKKQSVVRRVYDEATGRQRLIKGDGEVLEEIVSRDRHMAINKKATKGDGEFFQSRLTVNK